MLTTVKLDKLKPSDKVQRYSDRYGLTFEVRPSGTKRFIVRFQWDKKPQTIAIGRYPSLSLAEARKIAASYRALVDQGVDPRIGLKTNSEHKLTLKTIAEQWFQKNSHLWRESTKTMHMRSLNRDVYPLIGKMLIDDIRKADLLFVIHPHEERGHHEIAHRLHDRLKAVFDFAVACGLTENYPFIGLKKALAPKPKIKNQVAINPNHAHEMLDAIRCSKAGTVTKLYIELLAHLFVRPSELRLSTWPEFNLQQAEWHIPTDRMKMDAPHWVALTPQAISILRELRLLTGFSPYVFNSIGSKMPKPISETSARKLLHKVGYKDRHTLHGFRALASTVLHSESHFRSDAIEAQLAHKVQGVRGVYLRADFKQERRELMTWYSKWIRNNEKIAGKIINKMEI